MAMYDVKREHYGDKYYLTGEQREANPADVKHLVDKGVLVEPMKEEKAKTTKTTPKQVKTE